MKEERNLPILMLAFLMTQILAVIFTQNLIVSQAPVQQYAPFGNSNVTEATANSGLLIISVALFTVFLILVLKYRIKFVWKIAVVVLPLFFLLAYTDYHLTTLLNYFTGSDYTDVAFVISIFFAFSVVYGLYKKIYVLVTAAVLLLTAEIASFLAMSFSPPTLYILPLAFALYGIRSYNNKNRRVHNRRGRFHFLCAPCFFRVHSEEFSGRCCCRHRDQRRDPRDAVHTAEIQKTSARSSDSGLSGDCGPAAPEFCLNVLIFRT